MKSVQHVFGGESINFRNISGVGQKFVFLLLFCVTLTGCSLYYVNSEDTTTEYYPAKKSSEEVIFMETIDKPHEIIGVVTVNTERRQSLNDVIVKMKREAAILGGDAITNLQSDATGVWKKLPAQDLLGNGYVRANFTASVVIFKE